MPSRDEELQSIDAELASAHAEKAALEARIVELTVKRHELQRGRKAAAGSPIRAGRADLTRMAKAEAILAVLRAAEKPLGPRRIVIALERGGRSDESYNALSGLLLTMHNQGKLRRAARGLYEPPTEPE